MHVEPIFINIQLNCLEAPLAYAVLPLLSVCSGQPKPFLNTVVRGSLLMLSSRQPNIVLIATRQLRTYGV